MPIWEITQERSSRWVWRIRAEDPNEALRRIPDEDAIPADEEHLQAGDYEIRRMIPDA
jgi:hypothetical protein